MSKANEDRQTSEKKNTNDILGQSIIFTTGSTTQEYSLPGMPPEIKLKIIAAMGAAFTKNGKLQQSIIALGKCNKLFYDMVQTKIYKYVKCLLLTTHNLWSVLWYPRRILDSVKQVIIYVE